MYRPSKTAKDVREAGRVILAHGEVTGHCHEVLAETTLDIPPAQFFEEPDGTRMLLITGPCVLRHDEHAPIALSPSTPGMYRQGDVLLTPKGAGAWKVTRQREYGLEEIRQVAD
jgi:hypothetical protein